MDYVPSHGDRSNLADRDHVSGARTFDGEDQGMNLKPTLNFCYDLVALNVLSKSVFFRCGQQIAYLAVTTRGLDQTADCGERASKERCSIGRLKPT